jgi:hypothetical protein
VALGVANMNLDAIQKDRGVTSNAVLNYVLEKEVGEYVSSFSNLISG